MLLALAAPIGLLFLRPLTAALAELTTGYPNPTYSALATVALAIAGAAAALIALAVALRPRPHRPGHCASCGAPLL
jgi:hypothetical protein